ncbi:uncharacterized protein G2W53_030298 [Senna tora]|uniref:Uncharacterized protein n=1 Tax=Senna tora TaxID=362788 RepID=A0A834TFG4_9FABA|nr:uncharacterized protein G2W53_030298 [Senna tora]
MDVSSSNYVDFDPLAMAHCSNVNISAKLTVPVSLVLLFRMKCISSCGQMDGIALSVELDHIPLTQRRKFLHSRKGHPNAGALNSGNVENQRSKALLPPPDVVKWEYGKCNPQALGSNSASRPHLSTLGAKASAFDNTGFVLIHRPIDTIHRAYRLLAGIVTQIARIGVSCQPPVFPSRKVLAQELDKEQDPKSQDLKKVSFKAKCGGNLHENQAYFCPSLQQVKCSTLKTDAGGPAIAGVNIINLPQCPTLCDAPGVIKTEDSEVILSSIENGRKSSTQSYFPTLKVKKEVPNDFVDDLDHIVLKERQRMLLARKMPTLSNSAPMGGSIGLLEDILERPADTVKEEVHSVDTKMIADSFLEEWSCNPISSVKVKDEPWDNSEFHNIKSNGLGNFSFNFMNVKSEWAVQNKYHDDQVEHMCLRDRLKFLMSGEGLSLNSLGSNPSLQKKRPYSLERSSIFSESPEPLSIKRPRKRKKTATDSVQTALEEDAPGLLQVLIDKGVLVDEIKLYGEMESDEALDESFCEDSFADLEAVISKLSLQRHSFLKFTPIRATKASRATYCLGCLISLVEQTRYLQFRKWPVEWGWCRDLQSFIFVFERHNRIVLERPEYGFATYFFELVESLPIAWQIKRLVTAMKLSSCSRISLIENKALMVGEDMTEGEAQVLMEYGWTPNSGLGTMLNFCDRVVHDRKNEKDSSEWRSKIGKLLMDGYNGGTIVAPNIPKRASEYSQTGDQNL